MQLEIGYENKGLSNVRMDKLLLGSQSYMLIRENLLVHMEVFLIDQVSQEVEFNMIMMLLNNNGVCSISSFTTTVWEQHHRHHPKDIVMQTQHAEFKSSKWQHPLLCLFHLGSSIISFRC